MGFHQIVALSQHGRGEVGESKFFSPLFALDKTLEYLMLIHEKVQIGGNARAHVLKVRLYCPAVVTKLEGPRLSRLQPVLSLRCS